MNVDVCVDAAGLSIVETPTQSACSASEQLVPTTDVEDNFIESFRFTDVESVKWFKGGGTECQPQELSGHKQAEGRKKKEMLETQIDTLLETQIDTLLGTSTDDVLLQLANLHLNLASCNVSEAVCLPDNRCEDAYMVSEAGGNGNEED